MIVLDTNVVSEPLRPQPDRTVVGWLDAQHVETLALTTVSLAALRYGVAALPDGRRREALADRLEGEIVPLFRDRILTFDDEASRAYARLQSAARTAGQPMGTMDGLIAAMCAAGGHTLATRNVSDFAGTGLALIDPWNP